MTETIVTAAHHLKVPVETADGSARITGHSLRMTGAQGLARAGVDTWAIQLLGRWGSNAVLGYIQNVPLSNSSSWAARAARGWSLDEAMAEARRTSSSSPSSTPQPLSGVSMLAGPQEEVHSILLHEATIGSQEVSPADKFILSCGSRPHWHRVPPAGTEGPISAWSSVCGWRFSSTPSLLVDSLPADLIFKVICRKCLPIAWVAARDLAAC